MDLDRHNRVPEPVLLAHLVRKEQIRRSMNIAIFWSNCAPEISKELLKISIVHPLISIIIIIPIILFNNLE